MKTERKGGYIYGEVGIRPDQSVVSRVTSCDTAKLFILSLYAQCIIHVWHTNIWVTL